MPRKDLLIMVFCLSLGFVKAQDFAKRIEGRVFSKDGDVATVHVSNISTKRGAITDVSGYFEITARLNDTLVFSAVQYERVEIIVTWGVLEKKLVQVPLKESLTELDEVVVMPYNLTGDLDRDMGNMKVGPVVTASTLGLPNAFLRPPTQSERKLDAARTWDAYFYVIAMGSKLDPLINYFSGRTKMLNQRIAREAQSKWIEEVRGYYPDSLYVHELKIPNANAGDFFYSCEKDSLFEVTARNGGRLQLWEVLKKNSIKYLKDNAIHKK